MSPSTLLSLWRDRWQKPKHPEHSVPLAHGKVSHWLMDMARSENWAIPGLTKAILFAVTMTLGMAVTTRLTTNSQIVLSFALLAFAIYLRRHRGQVVALSIVAMSVLLTLRYFFWRLETTLPSYWSASLALGLSLLLAEAFAWLRSGLEYVSKLWPVEHPSAALPADAIQWPTLDILVIVEEAKSIQTSDFLDGLRTMNWPANKLRATVLTTQNTSQLASACDKAGIDIRIFEECPSNDYAAMINRAINESGAELVLVTGCQGILPRDLLIQSVGWFVQEPKLALAYTPLCLLAPAPSALASRHFGTSSTDENWAIVRRTALVEMGGFASAAAKNSDNTSTRLECEGYFTAYLRTTRDNSNQIECTRIDEPFKTVSLWLRLRLQTLRPVMDFYSPMVLGVFFITPLSVFFWATTPIVADLFALAAYWLPHWVLGRLALATALEHHRVHWTDFVQDELRGFAVLIRTAKSFLTANIQQLRQRKTSHTKPLIPRANKAVTLTQRPELIAGIALFGSIACIALYRLPNLPALPLQELYIAWTIFIALMFVAALAVQREMDWVEWAQIANKEVDIMVTLPGTHTVFRGKTTNFPQLPLEFEIVKSPPTSLEADLALHLSIFIGHREFIFKCYVVSLQEKTVQVTLQRDQLAEYKLLSSLVFSRHADWPMWLPPSHADRLLPRWLARLFLRAQDAFYNLAVKSALPATLQRLRAWLKLGTPTNG